MKIESITICSYCLNRCSLFTSIDTLEDSEKAESPIEVTEEGIDICDNVYE